MIAAIRRAEAVIFKRKVWGWIGRVLLLGLIFASLCLILMNDFLSERCWGLYLLLILGWLVNLGFVFEEMVKSEGWVLDDERRMLNGERIVEPLAFHFASTALWFLFCGLIILNPFAVKYYIPDRLEGLMIIDVIILQVIIFVDGFFLNKERIRNQVAI